MRRRSLQPFWQYLRHLSLMGQNHWATSLRFSGELFALKELTQIIPPGAICFDVGANHGEYSNAAFRILKPALIYAFQPSATAFETLRTSSAGKPVLPVRLALGSSAGKATLHNASPGASIGSMLALANPYEPFNPAFDEEIEVSTVDIFCREHDIDRIGLLKIDVEGFSSR